MSLISMTRIGFGLVLVLTLGACAEDPPMAKAKPAPKMEVPGSPPPSLQAAVEPEPTAAEPADGGEEAPAAMLTIADGDASRGAEQYALLCASCHGAGGAGDGPVSAGLDPKPTNHTDAAYMGSLSDDHLFTVVKEGGGAVGKSVLMAPWGGALNDGQIWDVVAHMRSLY
jgi:mono/diheme cytochrome c family protein